MTVVGWLALQKTVVFAAQLLDKIVVN